MLNIDTWLRKNQHRKYVARATRVMMTLLSMTTLVVMIVKLVVVRTVAAVSLSEVIILWFLHFSVRENERLLLRTEPYMRSPTIVISIPVVGRIVERIKTHLFSSEFFY